uniref:Uncharacterized protein n=1 Tax=Chlamydia trachomatis TaxID=813 RepID=A0A077KA28_CHLTH|nr:hypothetical protein [Chlamydia trachomatis]
MYSCRKCINFG